MASTERRTPWAAKHAKRGTLHENTQLWQYRRLKTKHGWIFPQSNSERKREENQRKMAERRAGDADKQASAESKIWGGTDAKPSGSGLTLRSAWNLELIACYPVGLGQNSSVGHTSFVSGTMAMTRRKINSST